MCCVRYIRDNPYMTMESLPDHLLLKILKSIPKYNHLRTVNRAFCRVIDAQHTGGYLQHRGTYFSGMLKHVSIHTDFLNNVVETWVRHGIVWVGTDTFMYSAVDYARSCVCIAELKVCLNIHIVNIRRISHSMGIYTPKNDTPLTDTGVTKVLSDVVRFQLYRRGMMFRRIDCVGDLLCVGVAYLDYVSDVLSAFAAPPISFVTRQNMLGKLEYTDCKKVETPDASTPLWLSVRANKYSAELGEYLHVYPFDLCCHCTQPWNPVSQQTAPYMLTVLRLLGEQHTHMLRDMRCTIQNLLGELSLVTDACVKRLTRMMFSSKPAYHPLAKYIRHCNGINPEP